MLYDSTHTSESTPPALPAKRGRGRPLGSLNKPKPPKLSPAQAEALKAELAPQYVDAVLCSARADMRVRGLRSMITEQLGRDALAAIEISAAQGGERA